MTPTLIADREPGPVARELQKRYAGAHSRLRNGPSATPKPVRERPKSPFSPARLAQEVVTTQRETLEAQIVALSRELTSSTQEKVRELTDRVQELLILDRFGVPAPHWKTIAMEVARKHGVSLTDLRSQRRDREVARARHEAFFRCRHETTMSLPQIGKVFGQRDHTTVLHGVKAHEQRIREAAGV